jgi:GNAT superfamily N-acetyltransferase
MNQGFTIRAFIAADRPQWDRLWAGYLAFYETELPGEVSEITWRRLLDPEAPIMGFCAARADGTLLGIVHYLFHPVTWSAGPRCYLEDLFTSAEARGQGVGRALIEAVYDRARAAGCPRVYWQTHETNATAMRLYDQVAERSGFVVYRKPL